MIALPEQVGRLGIMEVLNTIVVGVAARVFGAVWYIRLG